MERESFLFLILHIPCLCEIRHSCLLCLAKCVHVHMKKFSWFHLKPLLIQYTIPSAPVSAGHRLIVQNHLWYLKVETPPQPPQSVSCCPCPPWILCWGLLIWQQPLPCHDSWLFQLVGHGVDVDGLTSTWKPSHRNKFTSLLQSKTNSSRRSDPVVCLGLRALSNLWGQGFLKHLGSDDSLKLFLPLGCFPMSKCPT